MKLAWGGFEGADALRRLPREFEAAGFDTLIAIELQHDPLLQAAVLAEHTTTAEIMTGVAVAFARTPTLLAYAAHDLNVLSGGRFRLGLGSQTKPHILRRFGMPWSDPAERMREMISAIHAIWDCWYDGKPLSFQGQFYALSLMPPNFMPTDIEFGRPQLHLAAVGPRMTAVAAELADGLLCHSLTSERYIRQVTMPIVEAALARNGRPKSDFEITGNPLVATGNSDEAMANAYAMARRKISFYASTPSYKNVLELHGWGALHDELHDLSKRGCWDDMVELIDDDVLHTFAITGTPKEAAAELKRRFGGVFDRTMLGLGNDFATAAALSAALS